MLGLFGPSPAQRLVAFLIDWLILALAVWVAAQLVPGIHLEGLKSTLLVAGILGLLNALLKPTLKVLTIPLTFLTLGLFAVLLNAVLLALTDWITGGIGGINFKIDGFFAALLGAVAISLVTFIVGRFVDSGRIARGLSVDEKSQIQALDRTQPGLPMKRGGAGTMTHDYKRNGTTTLFAALNVLTGDIIGECMPRHRHGEFLAFLKKIDRETPANLDLHLIVDNYATHKYKAVERWLIRRPRFHLHFTPTSASWLNLVERFFAELTQKRIRRGVFKTVKELVAAIDHYLDQRNQHPKPFIWTASVQTILENVRRGNEALEALH